VGRRCVAGWFLSRPALFACALASVLYCAIAGAGTNTWTPVGPDGGSVQGIAWHPTIDGELFADTGDIYRSLDNGTNWTRVGGNGTNTGSIIFDPNDANRMLVSGQPVQRSSDGGNSFVAATPLPDASSVYNLTVSADGTATYATSGGRVFRTTDFAQTWVEFSNGLPGGFNDFATGLQISPADPNTLYVGFTTNGLYKSTDGGASWTHVAALSGGVSKLAINPNNAAQLLVGNNGSLQRSTDGGVTWSAVLGGYFNLIAFDPKSVNRVLAETSIGALYVSTDAGGVWLLNSHVPSGLAYSGAWSPVTAGVLAVGTNEGVFYSSDVGHTLTYRSTGIDAAYLYNISASRSPGAQVYATFLPGQNGIFRHVTGGWQLTNKSDLTAAFGAASSFSGLAVDPGNSSIVYAGTWGGIAKSVDGGNSWTVPSSYFSGNLPYSIAIDPNDTQVVYVASQQTGISRSPDGGATWQARNNGLPVVGSNVPMIDVFVDPGHAQWLYAITLSPQSLYRSTDSGLNWSVVAGGYPANESAATVAFDPQDANRVYIGAQSGAYRSLDGGITWSAMQLPVNSKFVSSILIDPDTPATVVLLAAAGAFGVVRSVDYGTSWASVPWDPYHENFQPPRLGALDPAQPGNLIVGVPSHGVREFQIAPDLAISLSGLTSPLSLGSMPTLHVNVQNKPSSLFATSDATMSLVLPATLSAGTITSSRGSCTVSGQSVACHLGAMHVGDTAQIDVPLTLSAGVGSISASVQPHELDAASTDNFATLAVTVLPVADLQASIVAPATVDHGSVATVRAKVTNLGPHYALNSSMTISLPPGLAVAGSFGTGGPCSLAGSVVSCLFGTLSAGASATLDLDLTGTAVGPQNISGSSTSNSLDTDTSNNAASASVSVRAVADLAITIGSSSASTAEGQTGTATVTVTNNGADPLTAAVATLSGTNLTVTGATPGTGTCSIAAGGANCSLGALAVGASRTIAVSFTSSSAGSAQLAGSVSSEGSDNNPANNSATLQLTVLPIADMRATISTPATLDHGSVGTLQLQAENLGPHDALNAHLTITLPAGLAIASAITGPVPCTTNASTITCQLGNMPAGAYSTFSVNVTGSTIGAQDVTASVATGSVDSGSSNDTATATIRVRPVADLAIGLSNLPASIVAGQTGTGTASITNNGVDPLTAVAATLGGTNVTITAATPDSGSCTVSAGSANCTLGALGVGASRTIAVTFTVAVQGTAQLTSSVASEGSDTVSANNSATGAMSVTAPPTSGGSSGGGSSGGGSMDLRDALALLILLGWRAATLRRLNR
jgi:hypothetical protein